MPEYLAQLVAHYSPFQWALIVVVLSLGSVIQGAVGFASGLFSIPLLVVFNIPLEQAAAINFLLTAMQNFFGAWKLRAELRRDEVILPMVLRWVGIPLGVFAMHHTSSLPPTVVKQVIGLLLLVTVIFMWLWRVKHRERIPLPATVVTFLTSGFLLGFAAIGGAPMVLYVNTLTWSAAKCRAFLFLLSATGVPPMAVLLAWTFGAQLLPAVAAAAVAMPFCWMGVLLGMRLGRLLDKRLFRTLTYGLLTVIAVSSVLSPWLSGR